MQPIKEFEKIVGAGNVFSSLADRQTYAYDSAVLESVTPALVVRPTNTEQLGAIIALCYKLGIRIVL